MSEKSKTNNQQKFLISIIGPTAIGKTALAIKIANHFNAEIISADSRQFYKEMAIGTAVPTKEELAQAPHHFIQHKSVTESYTVGDFERDAIKKIEELHQKNDISVMVGGSGLYVKAVCDGLDKFPEVNPQIREELNKRLEKKGLEILQKQLKTLDLKTYNSIALDNRQRVIRALEVCLSSEQPYSSFLTNSKKKRNFKTINIGLTAERFIIYDRINQRVDLMIEQGLVEEVKSLVHFKDLNSLKTVGYTEIFKYLNNEWNLETAISEIKKNTRRFAKRQLTWFRKDESILWFDYQTDVDLIFERIKEEII